MPIPTDTFWKISRLNKVFAISSIILLLTFVWSVWQDYDKQWRGPQKAGKVWEAALVDEKLIDRENLEQRAAALDKEIAARKSELDTQDSAYQKAVAQRDQFAAQLANLDFRTNTLKAVVAEQQKHLEEAKTAGEKERADAIERKLEEPTKKLDGYIEEQGRLKTAIKEKKDEIAKLTTDLDTMKKKRTQLTEEREALTKKRNSLQPQSGLGKAMTAARQIPLLQFINPAEKPKQVVVNDVLFDLGGVKTVVAIDRCTTCHVNIDKRDFTEEKVLGYLEEQLSTARKLNLPDTLTGKAGDPLATRSKPGAAAMPEFWVKMTGVAAPEVLKKSGVANRSKTIITAIGPSKDAAKPKTTQLNVTIDGKPVDALSFKPDATGEEMNTQLSVLATAIDAWLRYDPARKETASVSHGRVSVTIDEKTTETNANTARKAATVLVEDFRNSLINASEEKQTKTLLDRYRRSLVAEVNTHRKAASLPDLDPSPVILAHPRLDLYADVDSKHPIEKVGCTSCHDGSGMETKFVLAAHTPRSIWVDSDSGEPVLPQQLKPAQPIEHEAFTMENMLRVIYPESALTPWPARMLHLTDGADAEREAPTTRPVETAVAAEPPVELAEAVPYVDPVTGARGKAVSQKEYWKEKYEHESGQSIEQTVHDWDFPMRPPEFIQANCVRCHTSVTDIKDFAPVVHKGRQLFTNLGCNNCHQMDSLPQSEQRKVGTDLRHVSSKLSPAMINTWIWAPKAFRPTTKMPHFFMLENNSSDEEIRRTRQEALAITEYLVQTADPLAIKHPIPDKLTGKADDGRKLFNSIGCLACHQNLSDPVGGQRNGKSITRGEQWITQDLDLSGRLAKDMTAKTGKVPSSSEVKAEALKVYDGMSYNERQLYVQEHFDDLDNIAGQQMYSDGKTPKPVFMHHGPELSAVGEKLTAGGRTPEQARAWLFDWLKEPRHYSDYTVMPNLRLSDQQAIDLAEYLLAQRRNDTWQAGQMETDSEKLRELTGLFLRSRFSPNVAYDRADNETELRTLAIDALKNDHVDQAAAEQRVDAMDKETRRKVFLGKKLIANYGCMNCHQINGMDHLASPCPTLTDWGQKLVSKLDYNFVDPHKAHGLPDQKVPMINGLSPEAAKLSTKLDPSFWSKPLAESVTVAWPHVEHTRDDWLVHKLQNTRIWDRGRVLLEPERDTGLTSAGYPKIKDPGKPYDKIKMPTFYLNEEEVKAIACFVLSNRNRLVTPTITAEATNERARRIAHGRYLVTEKFNCTSCHQIEANKPQIQQYFPDETKIPQFAPPSLRSEGSRIQFAWLFDFVKSPQPIRPTVGPTLPDAIRMPTFPATDDEWTSILAYFSDIANKESQDLKKHIDPILKHRNPGTPSPAIAATDSASAGAAMSAGTDWFIVPTLANDTAYIREWALRYKQVTPNEVSLTAPSADVAKGYEKALYRARLVQEAFAAPFPFVAPPTIEMSDERFQRGEDFFHELNCLKCHTMGPAAPGVAPTAPNLQSVHARIRRGWAERWVREPDAIHRNSPMLQFFSGEKIGDPRGQTWARAQEFPPEQIARTEAAYGTTPEEQIQLVLDYVWTAGSRGHATTQPAATEDPPSVQMQKRGEIHFTVPKPPPPKPVAPPASIPTTPTAVEKKPEKPTAPAVKQASGSITGSVTLAGKPPELEQINLAAVKECAAHHPNGLDDDSIVVGEKGELKNVIVSINYAGPAQPVPDATAVIDQHGCQYTPHVLAVMAGQKMAVRNDDEFLHNVHSFSTANTPFNFGQPNKDPGKPIDPMKTAEQFRVKCDVHPWMNMYVQVFDHPFFAVTDDKGAFTIPAVPAGTYTVTFWHEKFGTLEKQEVVVEPDKKVDVKMAFQQ